MKCLLPLVLLFAIAYCGQYSGYYYVYYADTKCQEPVQMYAEMDEGDTCYDISLSPSDFACYNYYDYYSYQYFCVEDMRYLLKLDNIEAIMGPSTYGVEWWDDEFTIPYELYAYKAGCYYTPWYNYVLVDGPRIQYYCDEDCTGCGSNNFLASCYNGWVYAWDGESIKQGVPFWEANCDAAHYSGVPCATGGHCVMVPDSGYYCVPDDLSCDDDDPCTEDTCTNSGCQHEFVEGNSCTPSNPCFSKGVCTKSWDSYEDEFVYSCEGTKAVTCSSDDCHIAYCDALAGGCVSVKTGECPTNPSSEDSTLSSGYITSGASVTSVTALLFFLGFVAAF